MGSILRGWLQRAEANTNRLQVTIRPMVKLLIVAHASLYYPNWINSLSCWSTRKARSVLGIEKSGLENSRENFLISPVRPRHSAVNPAFPNRGRLAEFFLITYRT